MGAINTITVSATAAGVWSAWGLFRNRFNLSISNLPSSSWTAAVHVQRQFTTTQTSGLDVDSFTGNIETYGIEPQDEIRYRIGVKAGNWTAGTVVCRLSQ